MAETSTAKKRPAKNPTPKKRTPKKTEKLGLIARLRQLIRRVFLWSALSVFGFVLLWTLLYAVINPPTTKTIAAEATAKGNTPFPSR